MKYLDTTNKSIKRFLVFFVCVILVQCAEKKVKEPIEAKLSKEDQKTLNEYKEEINLGRNMAGRLLQFYGTYGDEELIRYVNQVGNYVASYGDFPDRRYMFSILDSETINAFACPGGYILLTLGSIRLAKNEAELAMILGHEIAHVGKKHMITTLRNMGEKQRQAEASKVDRKGSGKKGESFSVRVRKRPVAKESETGAAIARYLSGNSAFSILQAAKAGMSVILEKGLDKELEYEADQEGVKYAIRAGYNPVALSNFLSRLQKRKKSKKQKDSVMDKTHPKITERKGRITKLLKTMDAKAIVGADGSKRFRQYLNALPEKT